MLLPDLESFTYLAFPATELWLSRNHMFQLHLLKLSEVDVANPLMPQVDVRLELVHFREHSGANIIGFEDEHSSIPVPFCNDSTFVLDEASMMSEPNLHTLIYDLTDRHQVLDHCWYMQNVPHDSLLANMAQRDISLWLMGCGVSSPGSTTLDFSRKENHYVWFVM